MQHDDRRSPEPDHRHVTINLELLKSIGTKGVLRASGFLGLAFRRPDAPLPKSATLHGTNTYVFLPEPLPVELATELVTEFNAWLIGNALQELDRYFSLFVDEVWRLLDLTESHGKVVPAGFAATEISQDTNAARKYEKVAERLAIADHRSDRLWTISNARNCLVHAAGRVRDRDANDASGRLKLVWMALEHRVTQGDRYVVFEDEPVQALDPNQEAEMVIAVVNREKFFDIGAAITLTPRELHELCLYYSIVIDTVMTALGQWFAKKGILSFPQKDQGSTGV